MGVLAEARSLLAERLGPVGRDLRVDRVVVGLFFTGVRLSDGSGGVCYTPVKDIPQAVCCPTSAGRTFDPVRVRGMGVWEMLEALESREPIKTAVAIACLNALSASWWARAADLPYEIETGRDAQDAIPMPPEASVAVVGAFVPVLRRLKERGGPWWVVEQDPRTLKPDELPHYVPAAEAGAVLGRADVLVVTGVTLVNHTLEEILAAAKRGAEIAVMGPTASMVPDPLFARGVRVVGGVWVRRADELLDVLAAGGSGYHFFGTLADRIVIRRPDGFPSSLTLPGS
ncbi:MAG: Fis family transcriptional regulator [Candidatus Dadabacteria bacterium]|nr:MAG: Fis family transcriptional regulator [Candidatus Dadabacteria bacterium]